jgi:CheY-like chemotaxis protein
MDKFSTFPTTAGLPWSWESRLVLVVEDSDDDYFLLTRAFKKANFLNPVQRVSNGEEAIHYMAGTSQYEDRTMYPFPYIVLLDLKMPITHGFDVLNWARKQAETKLLPMLVFSSSQQDVDVQESYQRGANGYVMKPTSISGLTDVVGAIHTYWLRLNCT